METGDNNSNGINKMHFGEFEEFGVKESKDKWSGKKK
jgi:hypothetical protein